MKYFRSFFAILLFPYVIILSKNFIILTAEFGKRVSVEILPFWLGLCGYFIFQAVFSKPIRTYVFGHELTHALVGILSGAKLKSFKVRKSGGSVVLTKTNIWITLAPYFFPIYTVFIIALYWIINKVFIDISKFYPFFLFFVGFSISFHISLTHFAVSQGQSDLKHFGTFFSGVFVIIVSCLFFTLLLNFIFPEYISFKKYFIKSYQELVYLCKMIIIQSKEYLRHFQLTK